MEQETIYENHEQEAPMNGKILNIEALIETNYGEISFCVSVLADMLNVSISYLRELTQMQYGISPNELIESYRMKKAAELLQDRTLEVQNIYIKVGYTNGKTFREAFKKYHGIPPIQFKESIEERFPGPPRPR
jgi:AraC-like DNA-binding protein